MHLLFLNRSYWPDVEATGQLLTELCSDLACTHRVTVIAGRPNFVESAAPLRWLHRENHLNVEIVRVGNRRFSKRSFVGRVIGLLSYFFLAAWAAFRERRPDVIIVETDPPLLGALGVALKSWHGSRLVYYLQDLYPEVGLATGKLRPGLLTWLLHQLTQTGLRGANRIVVLGQDMRQQVLARGVPAHKIDIVPNWADTELISPVVGPNPFRDQWVAPGRLVVMYSGNHGLSQGLERVLQAARELASLPVQFLFVGEGAAKAGLVAQAQAWGLENVTFLPYQPKEKLAFSLGAADVHLITLLPGLAGYIVPSKLYGILAAGVPFLAAVDPASEVARVARESGCGVLIEPDSAKALVEGIRWCLDHPEELRAMGRRGRELAESTYNRAASVQAFERVLRQVLPRPTVLEEVPQP